MNKITFGLGVYNEEDYLVEGLSNIKKALKNVFGNGNYEIIIVNNGSTDNTGKLLTGMQSGNIRVFTEKTKGLGLAYKRVIREARFERVILSAIDLPFGTTDLREALKYWGSYDVIFGSKAHPKSRINTSTKRRISSNVYRIFLWIFFGLKIRDPQGSVQLSRNKVLPILKHCNCPNAFFNTQIAIYGQLAKLKMKEIPVIMVPKGNQRKSKFKLVKDGWDMLESIIGEFIKVRNLRFIE